VRVKLRMWPHGKNEPITHAQDFAGGAHREIEAFSRSKLPVLWAEKGAA